MMQQRAYGKMLRSIASFLSVLLLVYVSSTFGVFQLSILAPFGLASTLPLSFWAGYAFTLLVVLLSIRYPDRKWSAFSLFMLSLYQLDVAVFLVELPEISQMQSAALAELVILKGHADPSLDISLSFPGSFYLLAALRLITQLSPITLGKLAATLLNGIIVLLAYTFFSKTLGDEALSLVSSALVGSGAYMLSLLRVTSILSYILYGFVFLVLIAQKLGPARYFLIFLFFSGIVISHPYTPFAVTAVLGLFVGMGMLSSVWSKMMKAPAITIRAAAIVPLGLLLVGYWVYNSPILFRISIYQLLYAERVSVLTPFAAPTIYKLRYLISTLPYAALYGIPSLTFLILRKDKMKREIMLWLIGIGATIFVSVAGYSLEFFPRAFLFALIPLTYCVVQNHRLQSKAIKTPLLLGILLLSAGFHIPAQYGQESFFMISSSTFQGTQWLLSSSLSDSRIDAPWFASYVGYFSNRTQTSGAGSHYSVLSTEGENLLRYREGDSAVIYLRRDLAMPAWNRIYDGGNFTVWTSNNG